MKKYYTVVAMSGDIIDEFNTEAEARAAIELYEEEDRINGFERENPNGDYEVRVGDEEEVNACETIQEFVCVTELVY